MSTQLDTYNSVAESAIRDIIRYYSREAGVRSLEREISKICRKVVKTLVAGKGEDGARKHGMIIVRADSFEQARAIADRDPFHKAGLRSYSVDRWSLNEGSLTFTVNFSDQSVRTA